MLPLAGIAGLWMNMGLSKQEVNKNENEGLLRPNLNLDQEIHISDTRGVLNPTIILSLKVRDSIKLFFTDGTVMTGFVREITIENEKIVKIYGEMTNKENVGFGFVLSPEVFAGAVVFRNNDDVYTIKFSEEYKGYILVKSIVKRLTPSSLKKDNSKKEEKIKLTYSKNLC